MAADLLTREEQQLHKTDPDLKQLSQQDFLALKSRLELMGYYGQNGQTEPQNIKQAYESFKNDVAQDTPYFRQLRSYAGHALAFTADRGGHVEKITSTFRRAAEGGASLDMNNPRIVNDIARVAISDPGRDGLKGEPEFGRVIQDKINNLIEKYQQDPAKMSHAEMAQMQGALRSWGARGKDGQHITIDGLNGANTKHAVNQYMELRKAYFTKAEHDGTSGYENAAAPYDSSRPNAQDTTGSYQDALSDDLSLYNQYDEKPTTLTGTQIQVVQGFLNVANGTQLEMDGLSGRNTKQAVQDFFKTEGFQDFYNKIPADKRPDLDLSHGLNSHHLS